MRPRYFIKPSGDVLNWCLARDANPSPVPRFPEGDCGLVCAQLVGGVVFAEVFTSADHLAEAAGKEFPMGRLYFQIPWDEVYMVCPDLPKKEG